MIQMKKSINQLTYQKKILLLKMKKDIVKISPPPKSIYNFKLNHSFGRNLTK